MTTSTEGGKPKGPVFLQEDALEVLLGVRHTQQALNHLIMHDTSLFDPTIGDASCEQRVGFVLDTLERVTRFLKDLNASEEAQRLVAAYNAAHKNDKADTQVKTVADAKGAENDKAYDAMIKVLTGHLGAKTVRYVSLCYTFTVSRTLSYDEFRFSFSYRAKNFFATSTPEAEETKNQKFLRNHEMPLRYELASLSTSYFEQRTAELPRVNFSPPDFGDKPKKRFYVEEQLMEADHFMRSVVPVQDGDDIPLLTIYNQFRAIGLQEFNAGRGIIISVRRIQLNAIGGREEDNPFEVEVDVPEPSGFTYSHGDARALLFKPNCETGRFEIATNTTLKERETPYVFIDAWSTYLEGSTGDGLDSADHDKYYEALSKADPWWMVQQYAATHPTYTSKAKDKSPDYGPVYHAVCQPQDKTFSFDREHCEGFSLKMNAIGDQRPNLADEWRMASLMGAARGLTNCQEVRMGDRHGGCYVRIDRPVDFQIEHVHSLTFNQVEARCKELNDLHAKANNATIGRYVVRMNERGVSCTNKDFADALSRNKNDKGRRKVYLEKYPQNAPFMSK